nr:hypothetical protein BaRGS_007454 [Batillaria attramentaria]
MGKEIGYYVLGFRLLCLGPSLIPHLPEAALVQRQSKKQSQQQKRENKQMVEMVQMSVGEDREDEEEDEDLKELRNTASMTDVIKHDVFMQTMEMDDKAVHVEMQAPTATPSSVPSPAPVTAAVVRQIHTAATQTDKKGIKTAFNAKKKVLEDLAALEDADDVDEVMVTNIVCPPPLFYNSEAKPVIEVEDDSYSLDTDMSVSDELTVDSITDEEADETGKPFMKKEASTRETVHMDMGAIVPPPAPTSYENVSFGIRGNQNRRKIDRTPSPLKVKDSHLSLRQAFHFSLHS